MNPTSRLRSVLFWLGLAALTSCILVAGYGSGFWRYRLLGRRASRGRFGGSIRPSASSRRGRREGPPAAVTSALDRLTYTSPPMLGFLNRFVDSNDRELKRIQPFVDEANDLEAEIKALSDDEIRAADRRRSARRSARRLPGASRPRTSSTTPTSSAAASSRRRAASARSTGLQEALDDVLPEVFADGPRGDGAHPRHAPLRRAADRRRSCSTRARSRR